MRNTTKLYRKLVRKSDFNFAIQSRNGDEAKIKMDDDREMHYGSTFALELCLGSTFRRIVKSYNCITEHVRTFASLLGN